MIHIDGLLITYIHFERSQPAVSLNITITSSLINKTLFIIPKSFLKLELSYAYLLVTFNSNSSGGSGVKTALLEYLI